MAISLGCRRSERRKEAVGLSLSPCLAAPRVCSIGEDDTWVPVTLHHLLQLQRTRAQVTHSPRCQGPGLCPCVKVVPNLALRGHTTQPRTSRARSLGRATGCRAPGAPCRVCTRRPCRCNSHPLLDPVISPVIPGVPQASAGVHAAVETRDGWHSNVLVRDASPHTRRGDERWRTCRLFATQNKAFKELLTYGYGPGNA